MALQKLTYTDGVTVIPASNLNDIQDAIIALESSSEIFWATYNTTTESQIQTALSDGKAVFMAYQGEYFYLAKHDTIGPNNSAYLFFSVNQGNLRSTFVSGSYWDPFSTRSIPTTAADVGAIAAPSSPASGAFLVWNGSAWVAQTLATWSGGSY